MGGFILCRTPKARHPYYIENICTNIYSIEELCYYLYQNIYLIDGTIVNEDLCMWIQEELGLAQLAAKLRPKLGKFASAEDILYPVLKEINYLTYEELKELNVRLKQMDEESPSVRAGRKGDSLVRNGMYVNAIRVYQELLEKELPEKEKPEFTARIYHNLGCAYSYLFQMEKAVDCFGKACEADRTEDALKTYLLAFRSIRTPIEYESELARLEAPDTVKAAVNEELDRFAHKPEPQVYTQHMDEMLEKLTGEYHRSTETGGTGK